MLAHGTEVILSLISLASCIGLDFNSNEFDSWYLRELCSGGESDVKLSTQGPNSGGLLAMANSSPYYKPGMNCTVALLAPSTYKILLSFSQVETRMTSLDTITLEVEGVKKTLDDTSVECPNEDCAKYQFSGKQIQLNFSSAPNGTVNPKLVGFNSIVTAFVEVNASMRCPQEEHFRCQNLRCIWRGFYCNGQNNCGDGSDEPSHCPTSQMWGILVIVVGAVSFCVFVPVFCFLVLWGGRMSIRTTTSKYQPIAGESFGCINSDSLSESDFLMGSPLQYGPSRPHSYSFTCGSSATSVVQIHSPSGSDHLSKSLGADSSPIPC